MRAPPELVDAFRSLGLKITPQRQLLFRLLHDNDHHPTADVLYAQASAEMPGISLRTVYQTLTDLTAMGELQQFTFGTGPAHFDPNVDDHHHAVCDTCGAITDVYVRGLEQLPLGGAEGFAFTRASIVYRGTCRACNDDVAADHSPTHHPTRPNQ